MNIYLFFLSVSVVRYADCQIVRVLTLNTWNGGANVIDGIAKINRQIIKTQADIIVLLDITSVDLTSLLKSLSGTGNWSVCSNSGTNHYEHILTRYNVDRVFEPSPHARTIGCRVVLPEMGQTYPKAINLWGVNFVMDMYAPYAACNKQVLDASKLLGAEYAIGSHKPGRMQNFLSFIHHKRMIEALVYADTTPIIIAGDFNAPSHMDWVDQTSDLHCGWKFNWPISTLVEAHGFQDSYRVLHPDPVQHPGNTWSPIKKFRFGWGFVLPEPQDRTTFIYYKGRRIVPNESQTYTGDQPLSVYPDVINNEWPSDRAALMTHFQMLQYV